MAAGAEGLEEGGRGDVDAAFALDGLHDDAAGVLRNQVMNPRFVVVVSVTEPGDHRLEWLLILGIRRCGQTTHRAAVETVVEAYDFVFCAIGLAGFADFAAEFKGGFVCFGAGVADEDAGGGGHGTGSFGLLDEELREGAGPGVVVEVRGVD